MRSRYSKWDGSQDPFDPGFDIGELVEQISEDVLAGNSVRAALRRLMRRGVDGKTGGLDALRRRLQRQKMRMARELNLDGPLADIQERLKQILEQERAALAEQPGPDARMRETIIDMLPEQPAQRLKDLRDYRFGSPEAQRAFDELLEEVQRQVLDSYLNRLTASIQGMTPEAVAEMKQMLQALNQMISKRELGEPYDFPGFMQRFGHMFPENPRTLDELLEVMARRMAAMSRLMASLSPDQRRQLQELADAALQDMDLAFEMDMLEQELRDLMPALAWDEGLRGLGEDSSDMSGAVDAIEAISDMEELDEALRGAYPGASIDDIDEDKLAAALGEDAVRDLQALKRIERALEESGVITNSGGDLALTPRGIRKLGERALIKVFEHLGKEAAGRHDTDATGGVAEPTGATRPWSFGDEGQISVQRSVFNAVLRQGPGRNGVRLIPEDFELVEAESRTRTATALLIDLSFSMPLRGHWVPAKRMALALHSLIESKYPEDQLYLIGFSDYARRLKPSDLTAAGNIERVYGTNMQHAFLLARRLLDQHPRSTRQVLMVTDGEPTAHLEDMGDGSVEAFFSWPPTAETVHLTLAEATRLSSAGITLNIFMLEDEPGLTHFMAELARRTGGRVFQAAGQDLEDFVIRDFVHRRR